MSVGWCDAKENRLLTVAVIEPTQYHCFMEVKLLPVLVCAHIWLLSGLVDHYQGRGELQAWRLHQDRAGARDIQTQPQRSQRSPGGRPDREGTDCGTHLFWCSLRVYPTLKDKVGDAVLYVMLSKSHEETKTNNELILLTSPDLSSYSRHTVAVSWTQSYAHHFYVVDTFCCI